MTDTLNDVLSMQKIEEGKLELDLTPFSIRESIMRVCFTFKGAALAKQIHLAVKIPKNIPHEVGLFIKNSHYFRRL